jgi:nitroimidazol reductase NimA-like FMN-containing flavoprotein (pyridoxamine 5'-phosphate oxidase superfamily)
VADDRKVSAMSQGIVRRKDKEMSEAEVEALLRRAMLAHFATAGADGMPYVVPNLFLYDVGKIYLHTTAAAGHFGANVAQSPRISFAVSDMGAIFPYGEFECDTSASYASVVGFGTVHVEADAADKARFFDRFLAKYASPTWQRPKSFYPRLDEVTVYRIDPIRVTGKKGPLPPLAEQWPARNRTKSPGAVPPRA